VSRLTIISAREMVNLLMKLGFIKVRQRGSHMFFSHPDGRCTTVPDHPGEDLSRGLIRKILQDIEITPEEYERLRNQ